MRALKVEFAPRRKLPVAAWYAMAVVLAALAAQQGVEAWQLTQRQQALRAKVDQLRGESDRQEQLREEAKAKASMPLPYAQDAAAVAKLARFPIERLLATLESVQIVGVKVVSLNVEPAQGEVRMEVEYPDQGALLKYLAALNSTEGPAWRLQQAQFAATQPGTATLVSQW